jgi:folate-binding protein YgfZ
MGSVAINNAAISMGDFGKLSAVFQAMCTNCGVYELGRRAKIAIAGRDRVRWLNGMVSNNIRELAAGHGVYCFLLNPQGHILGDLYVYNRGESFLIDTDQTQVANLLATFRRYIIMDKVEITDVSASLTAIGVSGPQAQEVLQAAGLNTSGLEPLQFAEQAWQGVSVTLNRVDHPAVDSYELWLAPQNVRQLWDRLVGAGAKPVGASAEELLRIAAGIPRFGQDIRERDLPQETGQQRALNFNKGCYIGQEIVERIRSRGNVHRMFTGFDVKGPLPEPETKIQADGKDIGEITSVAILPTVRGARPVALGYIRREFTDSTIQVIAANAHLTVVSLPFSGIFGREEEQAH